MISRSSVYDVAADLAVYNHLMRKCIYLLPQPRWTCKYDVLGYTSYAVAPQRDCSNVKDEVFLIWELELVVTILHMDIPTILHGDYLL